MDVIDIEKGFEITNMAAAGDGGSLGFMCESVHQVPFSLLFVQFEWLENASHDMLPGRIYLNESCVDLKSDLEKRILSGLSKCTVDESLKEYDKTIEEDLKHIISKQLDFYNSEASLIFKEKVEEYLN